MFAGCDDRVVQNLHADGAFLLSFDIHLEQGLESKSVFLGEYEDLVFFEKGEKIGYTVTA